MVPDGTGDRWLAIVMRPDVTTADQRRDITVNNPTDVLSQSPLIKPCDPRAAQRATGEQLMRWVEDQWQVVSIAEIDNGLSAAQGHVITLARVEPVMVHCGRSQYRTNPLMVVLAANEITIFDAATSQQMQSRRNHASPVTMTDQADGM